MEDANDSGMMDKEADESPTKIFKRFNGKRLVADSIWPEARIPEACMWVLDTPEVQRLRSLKQVGCLNLVYPTAIHTRFEHSLGVCYLAGQVLDLLKENLRDDHNIVLTDQDVLCVQIAALCHDLGHGPLSHTFDGIFIPLVVNDNKWHHEQGSVDMLKYLLDKNEGLRHKLQEDAGLTQKDFTFINELIFGCPESGEKVDYGSENLASSWPFKGRGIEKSFLYEIVANKHNGIDVDKFDYFKRDATNLGLHINFSCIPVLQEPRVLRLSNGLFTIAYRDSKSYDNLVDLFGARMSLHRKAYQHRTNKNLEVMFVEVMLLADKHILFEGCGGKQLRLSETVNDMKAYSKVNDSIFDLIEWMQSDDAELVQAKKLLNDIKCRRFFPSVFATPLTAGLTNEELKTKFKKGVRPDLVKAIVELHKNSSVNLTVKDICVLVCHIDSGMGSENPLASIYVYGKDLEPKNFELRKPTEQPPVEVKIFASFKNRGNAEAGLKAFQQWCVENKLSVENPRGFSAAYGST